MTLRVIKDKHEGVQQTSRREGSKRHKVEFVAPLLLLPSFLLSSVPISCQEPQLFGQNNKNLPPPLLNISGFSPPPSSFLPTTVQLRYILKSMVCSQKATVEAELFQNFSSEKEFK